VKGRPVISIRRVSVGGGFRYLMESVAAGDGNPEPSKGLANYYAASGTPPGVFLGAGLADLGGGRGIVTGTVVTEEHLYRMLVELCDPVWGEPLGRAPKTPSAGAAPVAGFDLTFSCPKSVSVAWALADEEMKEVILDCHRRAVTFVLSYAEGHVFHSRSGTNGVVEEDLSGVVATAFTHWTSRADDPQLQEHVVVWNRAKSVSDGRWRTLDSKALFRGTTTLSELHQGALTDYLTDALGAGWESRPRRHSERPRFELAGVGEDLMAEFSQRAGQVAARTDELEAGFLADHGRRPTVVESMRLRQWATVATRPEKSHRSLPELTESWLGRAAAFAPEEELAAFAARVAERNAPPLLRAADLEDQMLADAANAVVAAVAKHRSTYGRQNLLAEAHRPLHGVRFASPDERMAVAERVANLAVGQSLRLTPPALCHTPQQYLREDGTSRLSPEHHVRYTTKALLDAEACLLEVGREVGGPAVRAGTVAAVAHSDLPGRSYGLGPDQALAVEKVATSGRVLDVLVGPSGSGKSTTMAGLKAAWESEHGPRSVVGLAPSAVAAEVLAGELGVPTENLAKWLTEHGRLPAIVSRGRELAVELARHPWPLSADADRRRRQLAALDGAIAERQLRAGQIVVLDEASLARTLDLDELVGAAREAGAKVLLCGDWAQLSAVDAGGGFALLVQDRGERVPELTDVRRFAAEWEKQASVELRTGKPAAISAYNAQGRVAEGGRDAMLDALYAGWKADVAAGRTSLMIAGDRATVTDLNARARADRVLAGAVTGEGVPIVDDQHAGVGDEVVTRRNDRSLLAGSGWVKNGDRWTVTATHGDGSLTVRRAGGRAAVVLPADYVRGDVELSYATTAHRSQGRTVDTAHVFVSASTTREVLYVAATRGPGSEPALRRHSVRSRPGHWPRRDHAPGDTRRGPPRCSCE
jgi:conjugative relaxase-like TrwC/TraI family protein